MVRQPFGRWRVLLLTSAIMIPWLVACSSDSDDSADDGLPSDPQDAIAVVLEDFVVVERQAPAALQTKGDVRDTDLGGALVEIIAICQRAETMGDDEAAGVLRRACDRLIYAGLIRSMASGNALLLLDGINQAKSILAADKEP
ncbi:MAG: hypothetical protein WEE64_10695 [Dehalococcoidia bacterium]